MFDEAKIINKEAFFIYVNAQGVVDKFHIVNARISGDYLQGVSIDSDRGFRTFRQDRVLKMFDAHYEMSEHLIDDELITHGKTIISQQKSTHLPTQAPSNKLEICFTGFTKSQKDILIEQAKNADMQVRDGVSKNLSFLCCGINAGPKKIESARDKGVLIIGASQFVHLLETGEIPVDDSTEEERRASIAESINDTFLTIRSLPRREVLIATFVDGYAAGWRFAVSEAFRDALDIKYTPIVHNGFSSHSWTQGHAFAFNRGDTFFSNKIAYTDWKAFLKLDDALVLQVKFGTPSGFETTTTLDGQFSGKFIPHNIITPKQVDNFGVLFESQTYDSGLLTVDVLIPEDDKLSVIYSIVITQVDFASLLQTGCYWTESENGRYIKTDLFKNRFYKTENPPESALPLSKKHITITGTFSQLDNKAAKQALLALGGSVHRVVNINTNILIFGESPDEKLIDKAKKLNIKTLNEDDLIELLQDPVSFAETL